MNKCSVILFFRQNIIRTKRVFNKSKKHQKKNKSDGLTADGASASPTMPSWGNKTNNAFLQCINMCMFDAITLCQHKDIIGIMEQTATPFFNAKCVMKKLQIVSLWDLNGRLRRIITH